MIIRIVTEKELRQCVEMDNESLEAVEESFVSLSKGEATVPPIMRIPVPERTGEVDVKSAHIHGLESLTIKIASGFYENLRRGLPSSSGLMVVVSAETGFVQSILLDNGYLTDVRTGLAGAIAAKYLAKVSIGTAGVIGSGAQARYQMRALKLVRDYRRLLVYGIVPEEVDRYVSEVSSALSVEVVRAKSAEEVVRNSDVVVTATPSRTAYLRPEWLHPGLHITAMGADGEEKQELFPEVLARADRLACDRKSQCLRLGELHHGIEAKLIAEDTSLTELGEIIAGRKPGRESDEQITVCDLTGVGVQDTAIALLADRKAVERGLGVNVEV
jgi:ectoine utilization protein EutC